MRHEAAQLHDTFVGFDVYSATLNDDSPAMAALTLVVMTESSTYCPVASWVLVSAQPPIVAAAARAMARAIFFAIDTLITFFRRGPARIPPSHRRAGPTTAASGGDFPAIDRRRSLTWGHVPSWGYAATSTRNICGSDPGAPPTRRRASRSTFKIFWCAGSPSPVIRETPNREAKIYPKPIRAICCESRERK